MVLFNGTHNPPNSTKRKTLPNSGKVLYFAIALQLLCTALPLYIIYTKSNSSDRH